MDAKHQIDEEMGKLKKVDVLPTVILYQPIVIVSDESLTQRHSKKKRKKQIKRSNSVKGSLFSIQENHFN